MSDSFLNILYINPLSIHTNVYYKERQFVQSIVAFRPVYLAPRSCEPLHMQHAHSSLPVAACVFFYGCT